MPINMLKKKLTLNILLFLILTDLLETLTQYCFKRAAISPGAFTVYRAADIFVFLRMVFSSPYLWIGIISAAMIFITWSGILAKIDLSVAVPVASLSYITVPLVSIIFLHEKVSFLRWGGIFFILVGVISVSLSTKDKESLS